MNVLRLVSGSAHPALAAELSAELQVPLSHADCTRFADGETRVHIEGDLRGTTVCIVQPTAPPVNDHLMELTLLIDAARSAGAARVIAVVPYLAYSRQEQRSAVGDPRSAQVIARLLDSVGLDHLVCVDLHAPALESSFAMPLTQLAAAAVLSPPIRQWQLAQPVIVSPDAGGMKRAQRVAAELRAELAVAVKERYGPDQARSLRVLGDVRGRSCVLVDDMASTGQTLAHAAEALRAAGARDVRAVFTHAVMAPGAVERLQAARLEAIVTTNTIPLAPAAGFQVVSVARELGAAVRSLL